jgi:SAM-dependent methyltransferase
LTARDVAPDGSPVEVYRRLPSAGEAELVHAAVPAGAAVLELGAGAGRITHGLVALGHAVTAVDESSEMLAHVRGAETVCTAIEALDLGRRFPVVVLASHFVNDGDGDRRRTVLAVCARHVELDGAVIVECYEPAFDWEAAKGRARLLGDVVVRVAEAARTGARVTAAVEYAVDGRSWRQEFEAEMLDEDDLRRELAAVGLRFEHWLDERKTWLLARG